MKTRSWLTPSLDWLLICLPLTLAFRYLGRDQHVAIFLCSCLAIIPLAGWLGRATEHLAARTSEGVGGLLNATFGNAAELIIAVMALRQGLTEVVKASLTGSIIGNILLVLGASFLCGGLRRKEQQFNDTGAGIQSTMMTLAVIALAMPAIFHHLAGASGVSVERNLSLDISLVLISTYALSLLFSLRTHRELFRGELEDNLPHTGSGWSLKKSVAVLLTATALIAWLSEILVGSVETAAHALGMSSLFVGVIIVAIVGNAAEHSTAILFAMKNRMDLSLGIAYGSSVQVALFVAPALVLLSYVLAPAPMDLVFSMSELFAIGFSVLIAGQIAGDGKSNWLEGIQLLSVYLIIGIMFYFLPELSLGIK